MVTTHGERSISSVTELAEAEKINQSYLGRVLRLALLARTIVQAILERKAASCLCNYSYRKREQPESAVG